MTFVFGFFGVLFSTISWQAEAYGFESVDTGILIILANISGFTSCALIGHFFKSSNYRRNTIIFVFLGSFFLGIVDLGY